MELIQQKSNNRDTHPLSAPSPGDRIVPSLLILCLLTLVFQLEAWLVLRVVTVEVHSCFMRCRQEGAWDFGATEPPDDVTGVVRPVADFNKVVVRLSGEV